MPSLFNRNRRKLFWCDAKLVLVALCHQRVGGWNTHAEWPLELSVANIDKCSDRTVTRKTRQPIVTSNDQYMIALTACDERCRLHDHDAGRRASGLRRAAERRMNPHVLAKDRPQHQVRAHE